MSKHEDNVSTRMVDRIIATAYKEAREALLASLARPCGIDKNLFSKAWIAKKIRRSEVFVKRNWKRNPYDVGDEERSGRPQKCSQGTVDIIVQESCKKKKTNAVAWQFP